MATKKLIRTKSAPTSGAAKKKARQSFKKFEKSSAGQKYARLTATPAAKLKYLKTVRLSKYQDWLKSATKKVKTLNGADKTQMMKVIQNHKTRIQKVRQDIKDLTAALKSGGGAKITPAVARTRLAIANLKRRMASAPTEHGKKVLAGRIAALQESLKTGKSPAGRKAAAKPAAKTAAKKTVKKITVKRGAGKAATTKKAATSAEIGRASCRERV